MYVYVALLEAMYKSWRNHAFSCVTISCSTYGSTVYIRVMEVCTLSLKNVDWKPAS